MQDAPRRPLSTTSAVAQKDSSCDQTCKETPAATLNTVRKAHEQARKSYGPAAKK